jgi:hypothetical protein
MAEKEKKDMQTGKCAGTLTGAIKRKTHWSRSRRLCYNG